jgi:hypothetical protein
MVKRYAYLPLLAVALVFNACNNLPSQNHGAIVLGDSSTIVTETDPSKLQDLVTDLKPDIKPAENRDSEEVAAKRVAEQKAADTPKKAATVLPAKQQAAAPLAGNGLKADFTSVSVLIPNLNAKLSGNPNLSRTNGAVYSWVSGNINNNTIKVSGNVTKVSQRYQTVIVLKNSLGELPLDNLSSTTGWEALKGGNGTYRISGLDEKSLDFYEANRGEILRAVSKAARRHRMSRRKTQEFENSVRNVRAANQRPLYVILRSVMWKIDGKDANGRTISKQIRVDIPL